MWYGKNIKVLYSNSLAIFFTCVDIATTISLGRSWGKEVGQIIDGFLL